MNQSTRLSEAERRLVELDRQKDVHRQFFKDLTEAVQAVADEKGIGHAFQDEEGIVYRVIVPNGTFIEFKKVDIERTRRPGETRGSLSIKAAEEMGFTPYVEPKQKAQEVAA